MVAGPETYDNKYRVKSDEAVKYVTIIAIMIQMFHRLPHCVIKGNHFFPSHAFCAEETMYSRLKIHVGFKIDRKQKLNLRAVHQLSFIVHTL